MAIWGCCCGCIREFGAFGFSNEKSLMYCAITPRFGWPPASSAALPPLVELAIPVPLRLRADARPPIGGVANTGDPAEQGDLRKQAATVRGAHSGPAPAPAWRQLRIGQRAPFLRREV